MLDDVITELQAEVRRRLSRRFGSAVTLMPGPNLYAAHFDRFVAIQEVSCNDDGSPNRNPNIKGHMFEVLEKTAVNLDSEINGRNTRAFTTDELAKRQQVGDLPAGLASYAVRNHTSVDNVIVRKNRVIEAQQLKVVDKTAALLEERYLQDSVSQIVVPHDHYDRHKQTLKEIVARGGPKAEKARIALGKLIQGQHTSWAAEHPVTQSVMGTAEHAAVRVSEGTVKNAVLDTAAFVVSGAIWEMQDAFHGAGGPPALARVQRLFAATWDRLNVALAQHSLGGLGQLAFEASTAVLAGLVKSAANLLKTVGALAQQIWDAIWGYFTGSVPSFGRLVAIVLKVLATLGIATLSVALEAQLQAQFAALPFGIGDILAGLLAAVLGAVAAVAVNQGIDALLYGIVTHLEAARAAKRRREQIEATCREALPRLMANREALAMLIEQHYLDREALFATAFTDLSAALRTTDNPQLLAALEQINGAFGAKLSWSNQTEFDRDMLDQGAPFKL
ncbi:hypothetical protein [Rhodovastum atsumiense]|uniref:Lactate permease n=1 Tax=Rhodovastum atsumiense TaxID=504468 RepID=A0A5M6IPF5_9PROT|nr:hypothetical protein [Rhodovastum atsumiense]KAA5609837.1 hypothetical protein F1189_22365 [Rhodovastum atsumiense]